MCVYEREREQVDKGNDVLYFFHSLPIALQTPDPRIHFALVCGARSCPPIKTYTAVVMVI